MVFSDITQDDDDDDDDDGDDDDDDENGCYHDDDDVCMHEVYVCVFTKMVYDN